MDAGTIERAVVVGGSVGGLAAAAVLAGRSREVVVIDRQPLGSASGSVAPHGHLPHILLAGGAAALERVVQGLTQDLLHHGAVGGPGRVPCHWWAEGAVRDHLPDLGVVAPMCTRGLLEERLRARVLALPQVRVEEGVLVRGLGVRDGRVRSVVGERNGRPLAVDADLVVDAGGRGSRASAWLADAGCTPPPVSKVDVGITYTAVSVRRPGDQLGGAHAVMAQNSRDLARIGVALAAEGDRWQVVLGGYFGDAATPSRDGMRAFARSLPDRGIAQLLDGEWCSEPVTYRFPGSLRRHWERTRAPAGFCAVGDAATSFNPLYGQGMSAAVMSAEAVGAALDRVGNSETLPRAAARAVARVADNPWKIATGADFAYNATAGHRPPGTATVNRYLRHVLRAAAADDAVNLALTRVQHLLAPPPTLFQPAIVRRVLRAGRRGVQPADVVVVESSLMST